MKKRVCILSHILCLLVEGILIVLFCVTHNSRLMYFMGVCAGIYVVLLVSTLLYFIIWNKKTPQRKFDERQLKSRGDCFCISFLVLLGCLLIDGMCRYAFDFEWSNYIIGVATWSIVAIGVFAILAIWKDAYTTLDENKVRVCILFVCISLINIAACIMNVVRNSFVENGQVGLPFINLICGVLLFCVAVNLFVKYKLDKRKVFEDEELKTEVC